MSIATWALSRRHARRTGDHPISTQRVAIVIALSMCAAALSSAPPCSLSVRASLASARRSKRRAGVRRCSSSTCPRSEVATRFSRMARSPSSARHCRSSRRLPIHPLLRRRIFLREVKTTIRAGSLLTCATHGNGSMTGSRISVSPSRVLHVPRAIPSPGFT